MLKHEPESLMMDHHDENRANSGGFQTGDNLAVTIKAKDYIWIRKSTAGLILIAILIVFILFGFIVHFLSLCNTDTNTTNSSSVAGIATNSIMNHNESSTSTHPAIHPAIITDKQQSDNDSQTTEINTTINTKIEGRINQTDEIVDDDDTITDFLAKKHVNFQDYRLTPIVRPLQYELNIVPLYSRAENNIPLTFKGYVNITIHVQDRIDHELRLHATALSLDGKPKLINIATNVQLKVYGYEINETNQFLTITTNDTIFAGHYYLIISFTGIFNDLMRGFYRSSYMKNNKTAWIVATQFEPTDARRAFPCFDEPDFKARFRIALGRPKDMKSLANMNLDTTFNGTITNPELPSSDFVWDVYNNTELMSTYLIGFAILDFKSIKHHDNFSVWVRESVIKQAQYGLDFGEKVLKYFEDFFNIKYPLPKMDMLAVPDFAAGAMENWGLTTFRETAMLYQKGVSPTESHKRVSTVIAHELAHQWFGNLVTPKWWSDLWLNEGFASYVEYIGVDFVHPEWEVNSQFVIDEVHYVMALDSLTSSHRISVEVHHQDEINEIFDRISYSKGASIIRMMDHFLSRKTFQKGLTTYLNDMKYGNAEQDDLWKSLTIQAHSDQRLPANMSVKLIMDTWTLQVGYPLITLTRNYEEGTGVISQWRFLLNSKSNTTDSNSSLWYVPINLATKYSDFNNTSPQIWMHERTINIDNLVKNRWVILNIQETGFYRVHYDVENWKLINDQLITNHTEIHELNRAQILDDSMSIARAGILSYNMALSLMTYLKKEQHYVPWKAGLNSLSYINAMLRRTGDYHYFKKFVLTLLVSAYKRVGFTEKPSDTQLDMLMRIDLTSWACLLGEHKCMQQSVTMFSNWMSSPDPDSSNEIPPDLRGIIYCTAIRQGTELEWNFAWKRYLNTNLGFEKEIILSAMGCSREPWILHRYMEWAIIENSGVRRQDATRVFTSVNQNPVGRDLSFNFVRNQWKRIKKYFGSSTTLLISIVKAVSQDRNTDFEKLELLQWIKVHNKELGVGLRSLQQVLETIQSNIFWMETYRTQIVDWMKNYLKNPSNGFLSNDILVNQDQLSSSKDRYQI